MSKKEKKKTLEELVEEALVPVEEQPYQVPENWMWVKLKDISHFIDYRGKTPLKTSSGIRLITAKNVRMGFIKDDPLEFIDESDYYSWMNRGIPDKGDILFTTEAPLGNVAQLDTSNKVALAQRIITISPFLSLDQVFLKYCLMSPQIQQLILNNATGSTVSGIKSSRLKLISIPLATLKEQRRIANKIDCLFEKIDQAAQLIKEVKGSLEARRASVHSKAFSGELTANWRIRNTQSENINTWISAFRENEKKRKFKDLLDESILNNLFDLPKEWRWIRLNELIDTSTYGTSAKANDDHSGVPVLRMGNIVDGSIEFNNLKYLPQGHGDVEKLDLEKNDLLFNRTNSYELVGKTARIENEFENAVTFASYLIRVRLIEKNVFAPYVTEYINSHIGRSILLSMVTQQVGQANINSQKLASLPIPVPPKKELILISNYLFSLKEKENQLKEIMNIEKSIEQIKQSILNKAFRGELETNDPSEESALELLKELLQEKVT